MHVTGPAFDDCKHLTDDDNTCWYFDNSVASTWGQASQTCIQHGGHLAVEQNSVMRDAIAAEVARQSQHVNWWIGVRNTFPYDDWVFNSSLSVGKCVLLCS